MLKEWYLIFEDPLDVLIFQVWFVIGDLNFPREQLFTLH